MLNDSIHIKFCGLTTPEAVTQALQLNAAFAGFVYYPASPRHLDFPSAAALAALLPSSTASAVVLVNPTNDTLDTLLSTFRPTYLQLHGQETPERAAAIKARTGLPLIKALSIASPEDFAAARTFSGIADWLLYDAKAPENATLPGGNGLAFDWQWLKGVEHPSPWLLSGGLHAENIAEAIRTSGASAVDVSSGIESARGVKDLEKMQAFARAIHTA